MVDIEYKDSLEQSFCRQRTDEEQAAIKRLSRERQDCIVADVQREIQELFDRPGMIYGVD